MYSTALGTFPRVLDEPVIDRLIPRTLVDDIRRVRYKSSRSVPDFGAFFSICMTCLILKSCIAFRFCQRRASALSNLRQARLPVLC